MTGDDPFHAVLVAAQAGAPWAFERLYLALAPAVAGYLRVQGAREPDDLTSEVFERAFTHVRTFSGSEGQFRSWVFTIAHHRLTDERRRLARRPLAERPLAADDVTAPAVADVEDEALRRLATERVRRLCDGLVTDQRDVMLLRLVGGLTVEETAGALRKTPGAVKALQHRGVAALRRMAAREGVSL